ncbi:MAG TPA: prepilin-type N-terminal cleavage/methylation domain-containing protein [Gemmatimonadaceae bacterium]
MSRNRVHGVVRDGGDRRGVTLVELLVAMSILSIGLMAIAGVSGSITRSLGESRSETLAATAAMARFEKVAGTQCSSLTLSSPTTESNRNITETYVVTDEGNNTRRIVDSVSWKTRRGTRMAAFTTLLPCRPGA